MKKRTHTVYDFTDNLGHELLVTIPSGSNIVMVHDDDVSIHLTIKQAEALGLEIESKIRGLVQP